VVPIINKRQTTGLPNLFESRAARTLLTPLTPLTPLTLPGLAPRVGISNLGPPEADLLIVIWYLGFA